MLVIFFMSFSSCCYIIVVCCFVDHGFQYRLSVYCTQITLMFLLEFDDEAQKRFQISISYLYPDSILWLLWLHGYCNSFSSAIKKEINTCQIRNHHISLLYGFHIDMGCSGSGRSYLYMVSIPLTLESHENSRVETLDWECVFYCFYCRHFQHFLHCLFQHVELLCLSWVSFEVDGFFGKGRLARELDLVAWGYNLYHPVVWF